MSARSLNQKDIYRYAEKILTGLLKWDELTHLSDDDLARIKTITERGPSALSEQAVETRVHKRKMRALQQRDLRRNETLYVPLETLKPDFVSLVSHIPFQPFPIESLLNTPALNLTVVMEALIRRLKGLDLPLYLRSFPEEQREALLGGVSPILAEDLSKQVERLSEEEEGLEGAMAKGSLVILQQLRKQELPESLQRTLDSYRMHLEASILDYCRAMPERLGLTDQLEEFSQRDWQRLTGLTPREDMARLGAVLSRELFQKLCHALPTRQMDKLKEIMVDQARERREDPERLGELLSTLRFWAATISKVQGMN